MNFYVFSQVSRHPKHISTNITLIPGQPRQRTIIMNKICVRETHILLQGRFISSFDGLRDYAFFDWEKFGIEY